MKKIYLFDFDGTISKRDSFILFSYFSLSLLMFINFWITTILFLFIFPREKLKERFFQNFVGLDLHSFQLICNQFSKEKLNKEIKKPFRDFLVDIPPKSEIVIVSASISNYLKPWCQSMGFKLISTELEIISGKLTGKFSTPNCNGYEKVKRIKEKYNLSQYDEIHVFGNSRGDFPMLELGTHKYYKLFS